MINTMKSIRTFILTSDKLFEDVFIPMGKRNDFSQGKSPVIPVYCYRYIGVKENSEEYYDEIGHMHNKLIALGISYLQFTKPIPIKFNDELTNKLQLLWQNDNISSSDYSNISAALHELRTLLGLSDNILYISMEKAFNEILNLYIRNSTNINSTLFKNFCLKILNWIHEYIPVLFKNFKLDNINLQDKINPKVVFYGDIKEHEAYFLIFLSKLGVDIIYINTQEDEKFAGVDKLNQFSLSYKFKNTETPRENPFHEIITIPYREIVPANTLNILRQTPGKSSMEPTVNIERREKTFEDLAKLSSSTVMITAFNREGEFLGTGSGVVIDTEGLIVTNYHVIDGGLYYGIFFEGMDENQKYETYTIINTNPQRDLALIKIYLNTIPVEINGQDDVVRGQRVVAIGSPLGLMNTFSDGIISGFRKTDRYDFVQTTAPTSPGSSGGALLNMYGQLVGITSAGYIDGQNLNLAVPSKYVLELLKEKCTIINKEISNSCSTISFGSLKVHFDSFFSQKNVGIYRVGLYQSRHDKANFIELTKNHKFVEALESYYIDSIKKILIKHGINIFDFQIGSQKYIFSFSYNNGKITDKSWGYIED